MKRHTKVAITIGLLAILLLPMGYFVIYPNYNELIGPIKRFNIERYAKEVHFQFLTSISPTKEQILGVEDVRTTHLSIEESLNNGYVIEEKLIEQQNTRIQIESIEVNGKVFEGSDSTTMNKGFWHFPISQRPGERGNFVVIGHRYAKLPPSKDTFFNLDKVKVGDKVEVLQDNSEYTYVVTNVREVEKNDVSVLENYNDYRLTLITCSPLWTSEKRLVITAKLDKLYKNT